MAKKKGTIRVCKVVRRGAVRRNDPAKREKGEEKRKKRERITRDFYSGSSRTITILNYESNVNESDDELLYSVP